MVNCAETRHLDAESTAEIALKTRIALQQTKRKPAQQKTIKRKKRTKHVKVMSGHGIYCLMPRFDSDEQTRRA